jgi:hypothetical protein
MDQACAAWCRYVARRTERLVTLPVQYVRMGDRLVVLADKAAGKSQRRNFTGTRRVQVLIDGQTREATGHLVVASTAERLDVQDTYQAAHPRLAILPDDAFVSIELDPMPAAPLRQLRGRPLWRAWLLWATLGEAIGFSVPAANGVADCRCPGHDRRRRHRGRRRPCCDRCHLPVS